MYICMYIHTYVRTVYVLIVCMWMSTQCTCSLDPEKDPLCVLLMIDYYAVRAGEYQFLTDLYHAWDVSTHPSHSCHVSYNHLYDYRCTHMYIVYICLHGIVYIMVCICICVIYTVIYSPT